MFARAFTRAATSTSRASVSRASNPAWRHAARRALADEAKQSSSKAVPLAIVLFGLGGAGYFWGKDYMKQLGVEAVERKEAKQAAASMEPLDYNKVASAIADIIDATPDDYDDGSYAPLFIRLAWHCAGTYDKASQTGGSNGATMRYATEANDGANAGLGLARALLEPVKQKFPQISYADLYTLAGVVAVKEVGGPSVAWRSGRSDAPSEASCPPNGRLPDASQGRKHIRDVFYRMGFDDREIVALSGAHALGRCHTDRSGYVGPWTFSPTMLTNDYFKLLLSEKWIPKTKNEDGTPYTGPMQYTDKKTGSLMMLPTDMEMYNDRTFYKYTKEFAKDEAAFHKAFAEAFAKLLELGVHFPEDAKTLVLA